MQTESVAQLLSALGTGLAGMLLALGYQIVKPVTWGKWQTIATSVLVVTGTSYGLNSAVFHNATLTQAVYTLFAASAFHGWALSGIWGEKIKLNGFTRGLRFIGELIAGTASATDAQPPAPPTP